MRFVRPSPTRMAILRVIPGLWKLLHNVVAHPLMGVTFDSGWSVRFHDWTAIKAWPDCPPADEAVDRGVTAVDDLLKSAEERMKEMMETMEKAIEYDKTKP